ncbi:MAG: right-handed parallel beta-helix repeat-containing protein [Planctomycetota bacterium]|nr:right-handed parallel beta-helix repeat-containing protein [Planctomycetota bacterium]
MERQVKRGQLFCAVCVLAATISANPIHVAPGGTHHNPGTAEKPVNTLRRAVQLVWDRTEPSEIIIHAGIYPGDVQIGNNTDRLGGPRPHILIRAATDKTTGTYEKVLFDGGRIIDKADEVAGKAGVYRITARSNPFRKSHMWETDTRKRYTLVPGIESVEQFPASFTFVGNYLYFHTSDGQPPEKHDIGMTRGINGITLWRPNITVRGLVIRNYLSWRWSAGVEFRGANTIAEDCKVSNCFRGYQIMMEPPGVRIVRCRADDVAGGVYSQGQRPIIEDNRLFKIRDDFMVPSYPQDDCAIQFYYPAFEGEVRRNLCVGYSAGIFVKCKLSRFIVEHNTVLEGIAHGIGCTGWHPDSIFRFNIVSGFATPLLGANNLNTTNEVDYNCFWDCPNPGSLRHALRGPRKFGTGAHNLVADPRFLSPATQDYQLLPDSPVSELGPKKEYCGAYGVVAPGFKDSQPPSLKLSASKPAKRAGGNGELYFERDPWIGGGRNLVRELPPEGREGEWVTTKREVVLEIEAMDYISRPAEMKLKTGRGGWSKSEPFQHLKPITLPEGETMTYITVQVSDVAGNWSKPESILIRLSNQGPKLKTKPVVYSNRYGAIVSFETDIPCFASVEFGKDKNYGSVFKQPDGVQRKWLANDGGDWVAVHRHPKVTNNLVLLSPTVETGQVYHYRLVLQDEVGNQTITEDAVLKVEGDSKTWSVSPDGADKDSRGVESKPWRTLQFAVDRALPGDRIVLKPGLYPGQCSMSHGGLEGAPITIEPQKKGTVILDGRQEAKACVELVNAPNVVFDGLEIRWFGRAGIYMTDSPGVTVKNCRIWNNFWMGWPVGSGVFAFRSPGFTGHGNLIFAIEQGIYLLKSPNSRITHNTILKNMYGAVHFTFSAEGSISRNNSFCFSGNDQYVVSTQKAEEFETFSSDYNNLGTVLRKPEPGDKIEVTQQVLRVGSKAVISLNGKRYNSLKAWQKATGQDKNSIFKHPMYADPMNRDFRLMPDSPNLGAGENGATIGAFGVKE